MSLFIRLMADEDKGAALAEVLARLRAGEADARVFKVAPESFEQVPGAPFAYWVSEAVRDTFRHVPAFETEERTAKQGLATADDFRFVRLAWEVPASQLGQHWYGFAKGGAFSPFYADVHLTINWGNDGEEAKAWAGSLYNGSHWSRILKNVDLFFRPGLTWPRRTTSGLALRVMPAGCIFADKGPAAFVADDDPEVLLALLAITNSRAFSILVELQLAAADAAARSYEVGVIQRTPVPDLSDANCNDLAHLTRRAWSLKRALDTAELTSHAFTLPALLQVEGATLAERAATWQARIWDTGAQLAAIQAEIDARCFDLYGFAPADRAAALGGSGGDMEAEETTEEENEEDQGAPAADAPGLAAALLDWLTGVAFGRFDPRLATGERPMPPAPAPFDPLPVASPGMLADASGLPAVAPPAAYPIRFPAHGILAEDGEDPDRLSERVRAALGRVFGPAAHDWEAQLVQALGLRRLEDGFDRPAGFFADHLARHSKSRRQAPLYWPLSTAGGEVTLWLYAPRLTDQTLYTCVNDFVEPRLARVAEAAARLRAKGNGRTGRSRDEETELERLQNLEGELRALRDDLLGLAPVWKPNLDDGAVVTASPLWRLFRHGKWQKLLKDTWTKLEKGDYDWAHLALSFWPERVRTKCKTDKSLAIAHGLEELYVESADKPQKKRGRKTSKIADE